MPGTVVLTWYGFVDSVHGKRLHPACPHPGPLYRPGRSLGPFMPLLLALSPSSPYEIDKMPIAAPTADRIYPTKPFVRSTWPPVCLVLPQSVLASIPPTGPGYAAHAVLYYSYGDPVVPALFAPVSSLLLSILHSTSTRTSRLHTSMRAVWCSMPHTPSALTHAPSFNQRRAKSPVAYWRAPIRQCVNAFSSLAIRLWGHGPWPRNKAMPAPSPFYIVLQPWVLRVVLVGPLRPLTRRLFLHALLQQRGPSHAIPPNLCSGIENTSPVAHVFCGHISAVYVLVLSGDGTESPSGWTELFSTDFPRPLPRAQPIIPAL